MPDETRSYKEIRQSLDEATQRVDEAISDLAQVLAQLQEWKRSRAVDDVTEVCTRQGIEFAKLHVLGDLQSLVSAWRDAAEAEYNHYANAHDDSIAPPRVWHSVT
jgi:hypothetical protein